MKHFSKQLIVIVLLVLIGLAEYLWTQQRQVSMPRLVPVQVQAPSPVPDFVAPATPVIRHPIEALNPPGFMAGALPALKESDRFVKDALIEMFGRKAVHMSLMTDDFVRQVVATADNLSRGQAASRLWPVIPTPGRFLVLEHGDGTYLADGNAERYMPFVRFINSIDMLKVSALYLRLYPLFQQAYEELGYPGKYFNDRVVEVVDQLLETPDQAGPVKLTLTEVRGSVPATRPWVRYEFADTTLEALPAGQKMLLRMGSANSHQIKAKLAAFRKAITAGS